jgi:hypothetical protein
MFYYVCQKYVYIPKLPIYIHLETLEDPPLQIQNLERDLKCRGIELRTIFQHLARVDGNARREKCRCRRAAYFANAAAVEFHNGYKLKIDAGVSGKITRSHSF